MNVKFLDLKKINQEFIDKFSEQFKSTVDSGWLINGDRLREFEDDFASYSGVKYCVGVANGLDALKLALLANGVNSGDEVIVPSNTFIATWLAVTQIGAIPVGVDPNIETYNIDVSQIERHITKKTKAIIPVHLYGQPAELDTLFEIANLYNISVIQDAAQAHGSSYKDKKICEWGGTIATSFYPGKNLGALGDAGAVLTDSYEIAKFVRMYANYGSSTKYKHELSGTNSRLDELQAAFLKIKLNRLDRDNSRRAEIASFYNKHIINPKILTPFKSPDAVHVWHLYVIQCKFRDELKKHLFERNVESMIHYPVPCADQLCYSGKYISSEFVKNLSSKILSLPISPVMTMSEIKYVVDAVNSY